MRPIPAGRAFTLALPIATVLGACASKPPPPAPARACVDGESHAEALRDEILRDRAERAQFDAPGLHTITFSKDPVPKVAGSRRLPAIAYGDPYEPGIRVALAVDYRIDAMTDAGAPTGRISLEHVVPRVEMILRHQLNDLDAEDFKVCSKIATAAQQALDGLAPELAADGVRGLTARDVRCLLP